MSGGPVPGFAQDILTRMINVRWGGGPFIAADNFAHVFYGTPKPKKPGDKPPSDWVDLGTLDFKFGTIHGGAASGSAYVLVGYFADHSLPDPGPDKLPQGPMIMVSTDGLKWRVAYRDFVFNRPGFNSDEIFFGAVHDGKNFYAASYYVETTEDLVGTAPPAVIEGERLYKSSNGISWTKSAEQMKTGENANLWPADAPSLLVPYCTKPSNRGADSTKKIPDGLQAGSDILIKPFSLDYYSIFGAHYDPSVPETKVRILRPATDPQTRNVGMPATCVATNGSTWVTGGGWPPRIDASFDGGQTWAESFTAKRDEETESEGDSGRRMAVVMAKARSS